MVLLLLLLSLAFQHDGTFDACNLLRNRKEKPTGAGSLPSLLGTGIDTLARARTVSRVVFQLASYVAPLMICMPLV
jgi:hypothetical protein